MTGHHILGTFILDNNKELKNVEDIRAIILACAREADMTVVGEVFHQFKPIGCTGALILAESHFTIHTWPEYNKLAYDIYTCNGDHKILKAHNYLRDYFSPIRDFSRHIVRDI